MSINIENNKNKLMIQKLKIYNKVFKIRKKHKNNYKKNTIKK